MVLLGVNVTVVCGAGGPFDGERTHRHQCIRRFALIAVAVVSAAVARVLCRVSGCWTDKKGSGPRSHWGIADISCREEISNPELLETLVFPVHPTA